MAGVASNQLKEKKEQILLLWEDRCLKEVLSAGPSASLLTEVIFEFHILREVLFTVANAELERLAEGEAGYRAAMMRADAARAGYAVQDIGLVKASRLRSTDREEFERMRALICARQDAVMKALARAATVAFDG